MRPSDGLSFPSHAISVTSYFFMLATLAHSWSALRSAELVPLVMIVGEAS